MIPSDATRMMLREPTFGPQMGAVRQRSNYAFSPTRLASSVVEQGAARGCNLVHSPHPTFAGVDVGSLRCRQICRSGRPRFFWGALLLTPPQSVFSLPGVHNRRGRGRPQKAKTSVRGYGAQHQRLRRQLKKLVDAGGARCWRCGKPIVAGEHWDLGHDDHDRSKYRGPEHLRCNRATASRRRRQSREW
jgi:hypothetical protein